MFNLDERKLMLILAHEEYEHLLAPLSYNLHARNAEVP
jgi:hypothetical protein